MKTSINMLGYFFTLFIGLGMIGFWTYALLAKAVPEMETEPYSILFHIAGEYVTGILLVISSIHQLRGARLGPKLYPVALGLLCYTLIVSPGYYAQQGNIAVVIMFLTVLILVAGILIRSLAK